MIIKISHRRLAPIILLAFTSLLAVLFIWYLSIPNRTPLPPAQDNTVNFGEFLAWEQARLLFPRYSCAIVVDFNTGREFRVQRRAGSLHADVQPLTAADTETMKSIYGGHWDWKRRAIVLKLDDGRQIAASMNGMPHGDGAIQGNKFPGHFCIHFRGSKTHGSKRVDTAHQIMVWKAAGVIDQQLAAMSQEEVIRAFFTTIDQGDEDLNRAFLDNEPDESYRLPDMEYCQLRELKRLDDRTFAAVLRLRRAEEKTEQKLNLNLEMVHEGHWQIRSHSLKTLRGSDSALQTLANTFKPRSCAV